VEEKEEKEHRMSLLRILLKTERMSCFLLLARCTGDEDDDDDEE
jgi:hypothetical protein